MNRVVSTVKTNVSINLPPAIESTREVISMGMNKSVTGKPTRVNAKKLKISKFEDLASSYPSLCFLPNQYFCNFFYVPPSFVTIISTARAMPMTMVRSLSRCNAVRPSCPSRCSCDHLSEDAYEMVRPRAARRMTVIEVQKSISNVFLLL